MKLIKHNLLHEAIDNYDEDIVQLDRELHLADVEDIDRGVVTPTYADAVREMKDVRAKNRENIEGMRELADEMLDDNQRDAHDAIRTAPLDKLNLDENLLESYTEDKVLKLRDSNYFFNEVTGNIHVSKDLLNSYEMRDYVNIYFVDDDEYAVYKISRRDPFDRHYMVLEYVSGDTRLTEAHTKDYSKEDEVDLFDLLYTSLVEPGEQELVRDPETGKTSPRIAKGPYNADEVNTTLNDNIKIKVNDVERLQPAREIAAKYDVDIVKENTTTPPYFIILDPWSMDVSKALADNKVPLLKEDLSMKPGRYVVSGEDADGKKFTVAVLDDLVKAKEMAVNVKNLFTQGKGFVWDKEDQKDIPLNEALDDLGEVPQKLEIDETVPEPPKGENTGIATILSNLIQDEWQAIDGYNSALETLASINFDEGMVDVLKDIVAEENVHIGQLQKALELVAPNATEIQHGVEEGEEQLAAAGDKDLQGNVE